VRLIQLTDTHLEADPGAELKGINVRRTLTAVLDLVRSHEPDFSAFLLTGDLSHDETLASYRALSDLIRPFGRPAFALAGNHDDPAAMTEGFSMAGGGVRTGRNHPLGNWHLVLADSRIPGEVGGRLSESEQAALDRVLSTRREASTLLALHHHPVPTGTAWMDAIALENPEALEDLLKRHPQVRGVVWGHVHQEQDAAREGVRLLGTPATCIQFHPTSQAFALDDRPPGYRWIDLRADGTLATGVRRLPAWP
jgi:3',5'-cyclic-AMP phosphodiesterase